MTSSSTDDAPRKRTTARTAERTSVSTTQVESGPEHKNIVFFHPDLGIGGAERLIIDAAVSLQNVGHKVTLFTSYCNKGHCFDEARDGTLDVRVRGDSLIPATLLGRCKILCSILRQLHMIYAITWSGELAKLRPSVFVLDQLSAGIPWLRWYWEDVHILFYCHFPDLLLVRNRQSWHKKIWRLGFDWLEGWSIGGADRVVANSNFTKQVVTKIWPALGGERGVGIVYPCVNTHQKENTGTSTGTLSEEKQSDQPLWKGKQVLLSINRFERTKNIELAIQAYAGLRPEDRRATRLVIAGGYDPKVLENSVYHKDLESLAASLGLRQATAKNIVSAQAIPDEIELLFLLSVPEQLKTSLLQTAKLLLYTPSNEHFGIVPLEAMLAGVPVLATSTGGPLETVVDGQTGWLRSADQIEQWTDIMHQVLHTMSPSSLQEMGRQGQARVRDEFSATKMAHRFDEELNVTIKGPRPERTELGDIGTAIALYISGVGVIFFTIYEGRKEIKNLPIDFFFGSIIIGLAIIMIIAVSVRLSHNVSAFM